MRRRPTQFINNRYVVSRILNTICSYFRILPYVIQRNIVSVQLGENHEKTKESSDCLRHLTQQAVVLQKKMNEIYTGKPATSLPPIQIQAPSMGSVLDMLNVINGILFVQIR